MKRVLVFITTLLMALALSANENRITLPLNAYSWFIVNSETISDDNGNSILSNGTSLAEQDSIDQNSLFAAQIEIEQEAYNLAVLYIYADDDLFTVYINGEEIMNELSGDNFHSEITQFAEQGSFVLEVKPRAKVAVAYFTEVIENAQIAIMHGVVLCHFSLKKDEYFGGKLMEVDIRNFLTNDVDGKVYVRLLEKSTWNVVAENNNCAFARSGIETTIEVNFPNFDHAAYGKTYIAEVEIVDKENDEAIVDKIALPLKF